MLALFVCTFNEINSLARSLHQMMINGKRFFREVHHKNMCYFIMCIIHCDSICVFFHLNGMLCVAALWDGFAIHYATAHRSQYLLFFASIHWFCANACFSTPLKITFANSSKCSCNLVFSTTTTTTKSICNLPFSQ